MHISTDSAYLELEALGHSWMYSVPGGTSIAASESMLVNIRQRARGGCFSTLKG